MDRLTLSYPLNPTLAREEHSATPVTVSSLSSQVLYHTREGLIKCCTVYAHRVRDGHRLRPIRLPGHRTSLFSPSFHTNALDIFFSNSIDETKGILKHSTYISIYIRRIGLINACMCTRGNPRSRHSLNCHQILNSNTCPVMGYGQDNYATRQPNLLAYTHESSTGW